MTSDARGKKADKLFDDWRTKYGTVAQDCIDREHNSGNAKVNTAVMETTVVADAPLPLSAGKATTAANVQMALESNRPQDSAFLQNAHVYNETRLQDINFPDMELFKNVCHKGHPLQKASMSDYLANSERKTFRCVQCDQDIGMARATTTARSPSFMLCCSIMCESPFGVTCADCAGIATCTDHSLLLA